MRGVNAEEGVDDGPLPNEFVARTVKVYGVPFASPITTQDSPVVVQVAPPGAAVTVYPVVGAPPADAAVHARPTR